MTRILLTAGFDRAAHVYALAELAQRNGIEVAGILTVSPYTLKRARTLMRRHGRSFFSRSLPRLLGRTPASRQARTDAFSTWLTDREIVPGSLKTWAQKHGAPYRIVPSINAPEAVNFVQAARADWVVYGGGGILHEPFIDAAGGRILNAHAGPLPEIRGMNACEWSLLLGHPPAVTIHLIDRGIDTGAIVSRNPLQVYPGDSIEDLRSRSVALGVQALIDALLDPPSTTPASLDPPARQCFVLAPALREVLAHRLAADQAALALPVAVSMNQNA